MDPPTKKRRKLSNSTTNVPAASNPTSGDAPLSSAPADRKDPRTLFVRHLAPATTTADLTQHFSQTYPIKHAVAVLDAPGSSAKTCRGYGFVTFADPVDAAAARAALHGSELLGRRISVEQAQVRHRDDDDGGDGGKAAPRHPGRHEASKLPPTKLIVRNLPWSVDHVDKFAALFRSFGKINEAILPKNPDGRLRGFGIVILRGRKNAERAMEVMNGKEVDGRAIAVDWAADRETWEKAKQAETANDDAAENGSGTDNMAADETSDVEMQDVEDSMDEEQDLEASQNGEDEELDESPAPSAAPRPNNTPCTVFIRNLPYSCTDDNLMEHFEQFGPVRYARVVYDSTTGQSKGTGFVCFRHQEDATRCAKEAPRTSQGDKSEHAQESVLQDYSKDPTGEYTLDGRVLSVAKAVEKDEATRLYQHGAQLRNTRDKDKRRLYLLTEGRIKSNSEMYEKLSTTEIAMREASAKQRKALVEKNPALHLSLTRLSVRNIPKFVTSKDLKALARDAFVGFATDVRGGLRQKLSPEEIARGGEEMKAAEHERKAKGKGVVKQAKVVFETKEGSKIAEADGAGRSRGYGFIEYHTHRSALMGLRWLNGREIDVKSIPALSKVRDASAADRKRRLIVEFALENVNVVKRRGDREVKARGRPGDRPTGERREATTSQPKPLRRSRNPSAGPKRPPKRSTMSEKSTQKSSAQKPSAENEGAESKQVGEQNQVEQATKQRIIARKRTARRARKMA